MARTCACRRPGVFVWPHPSTAAAASSCATRATTVSSSSTLPPSRPPRHWKGSASASATTAASRSSDGVSASSDFKVRVTNWSVLCGDEQEAGRQDSILEFRMKAAHEIRNLREGDSKGVWMEKGAKLTGSNAAQSSSSSSSSSSRDGAANPPAALARGPESDRGVPKVSVKKEKRENCALRSSANK